MGAPFWPSFGQGGASRILHCPALAKGWLERGTPKTTARLQKLETRNSKLF